MHLYVRWQVNTHDVYILYLLFFAWHSSIAAAGCISMDSMPTGNYSSVMSFRNNSTKFTIVVPTPTWQLLNGVAHVLQDTMHWLLYNTISTSLYANTTQVSCQCTRTRTFSSMHVVYSAPQRRNQTCYTFWCLVLEQNLS